MRFQHIYSYNFISQMTEWWEIICLTLLIMQILYSIIIKASSTSWASIIVSDKCSMISESAWVSFKCQLFVMIFTFNFDFTDQTRKIAFWLRKFCCELDSLLSVVVSDTSNKLIRALRFLALEFLVSFFIIF